MKKLLLTGAAILAATGCGGISGEPLTAVSMVKVIGELTTAMRNMPTSNTAPALPVAGVTLSSNVSTMATECETISPAVIVDKDEDQIAASKVSTFDCTNQVAGNFQNTRKGTITIKDLDETKKGVEGGYRVDFAISQYDNKDLTNGQEYKYSYNGFWLSKTEGNTLISTADFTGLNNYSNNLGSNNYTYNYTWDWRMTPTNSAQFWDAGTLSVSGSFSLSGDYIGEDGGAHVQKSGTFVVKYYSKDLKYSNACGGNFYQSGSFFVDDSYGTVIEVRYDCGNPVKYYVNGKESSLFD